MSKRKQALRSLSANECGAVSALPTEPIRAPFIFRLSVFVSLRRDTQFSTLAIAAVKIGGCGVWARKL